MASSKTKAGTIFLMALPFFIILTAIISVDSACHAYLHTESSPLSNHHLFTELTTALLASLLIGFIFLLTRQQYAKEKDSEKSPRATEDWEKTFHTMADFVSVHDQDYRIVRVNQSLCDFLGKKPEELVGKFCYQIFHNTNKPFKGCPHQKSAEVKHSVSELIVDSHIGVPLQITCSPLFNDEHKFQGTVHIARVYELAKNRRRKSDGIIPICATCKNIRMDDRKWVSPEEYFVTSSGSRFSHTICYECQAKLYPKYIIFD